MQCGPSRDEQEQVATLSASYGLPQCTLLQDLFVINVSFALFYTLACMPNNHNFAAPCFASATTFKAVQTFVSSPAPPRSWQQPDHLKALPEEKEGEGLSLGLLKDPFPTGKTFCTG